MIPSFALRDAFQSRAFLILYVLTFVPVLVQIALVYLSHNSAVRSFLPAAAAFAVDNAFFHRNLAIQGFLAVVITAWIGPTLIAPDLANGALPLYLSRPLTRTGYVAGKMGALLLALSLVTWVPNLLVFTVQGSLAGADWVMEHLRIAWATVAGGLLWNGLLAFVVVAASVWLRSRLAATAALPALFFIGPALARVWNLSLDTYWGRVFDVNYLVSRVWLDLFELPVVPRRRGVSLPDLPVWASWTVLLLLCAFCLFLLERRLRAREVVR